MFIVCYHVFSLYYLYFHMVVPLYVRICFRIFLVPLLHL